MSGSDGDPHAAGRIAWAGAPLSRARCAAVLLHGRGGDAQNMLALADHLALPEVAAVAPQAAVHSWWPQSFLAPLAHNEPGLSSGLRVIERIVEELGRHGFGPERTVLLGFSQGACLTLEYAARTGTRFMGVIGLSGGLLGTADAADPPRDELYGHAPKRFDYESRLDGTTVFLGCHERDPHIPLARVRASERVFTHLGAEVTCEIYPGSGHAVVEPEIRFIRALLQR